MSNFLGKKNLSRGVRNNNPGNLVYSSANNWVGKIPKSQSTDSRFEQFKEVKFGIRAMFIDILGDIRKGKNTLRKLISEYAPSFENNTNSYISIVSKKTGVAPDKVLKDMDYLFYQKLARAIIDHENGKDGELITDSDILDAIDLVDRKELNGAIARSKKINPSVFLIPLLLFFYTVLTVAL